MRFLIIGIALLFAACMQTEEGKSPTEGTVPPPVCELNLSPDTARIMKFNFSSNSMSGAYYIGNITRVYTYISDSADIRTFSVRDSGRKQLSFNSDTIDFIETDTVQVPVFELKLALGSLRDLDRIPMDISRILRVKGCMYSIRDSSLSESWGSIPNGTITHVRVNSDSIVINMRYRGYTTGSGYDVTYASDGQLLSWWQYFSNPATEGQVRFTRIPIDSIATPSSPSLP